jgi:hypothetical protein
VDQIIENAITFDGMRSLKVIGEVEIDAMKWQAMIPNEAQGLVKCRGWKDESLGIYYLTMVWPARDCIPGVMVGKVRYERPMVIWRMVAGERVSTAIQEAAKLFKREHGRQPEFAWLKTIPKGAEQYVEDVELLQVDWAYPGCVMVGG